MESVHAEMEFVPEYLVQKPNESPDEKIDRIRTNLRRVQIIKANAERMKVNIELTKMGPDIKKYEHRKGLSHPFLNKVIKLKAALYAAVSEGDIIDIAHALVRRAKGGDINAAKEVLQRLLGAPVDYELQEKYERLEELATELQQRMDSKNEVAEVVAS